MQVGTRVIATRNIDDRVSNVFVSQGSEGTIAYVYFGLIGPSKYLVAFEHGRITVPAQNPPIRIAGNLKIASLIQEAQEAELPPVVESPWQIKRFTNEEVQDAVNKTLNLVDPDILAESERDDIALYIEQAAPEYTKKLDPYWYKSFKETVIDAILYELKTKPRVEIKEEEERRKYEEMEQERRLEEFEELPEVEEGEVGHAIDIPQGTAELWVNIESDNGYSALQEALSKIREVAPAEVSFNDPADYYTESSFSVPPEDAEEISGYLGGIIEFAGPLSEMRDLYVALQDLVETADFFIDLEGSELLLPGGIVLENKNYEVAEYLEVLPKGVAVAKLMRRIQAHLKSLTKTASYLLIKTNLDSGRSEVVNAVGSELEAHKDLEKLSKEVNTEKFELGIYNESDPSDKEALKRMRIGMEITAQYAAGIKRHSESNRPEEILYEGSKEQVEKYMESNSSNLSEHDYERLCVFKKVDGKWRPVSGIKSPEITNANRRSVVELIARLKHVQQILKNEKGYQAAHELATKYGWKIVAQAAPDLGEIENTLSQQIADKLSEMGTMSKDEILTWLDEAIERAGAHVGEATKKKIRYIAKGLSLQKLLMYLSNLMLAGMGQKVIEPVREKEPSVEIRMKKEKGEPSPFPDAQIDAVREAMTALKTVDAKVLSQHSGVPFNRVVEIMRWLGVYKEKKKVSELIREVAQGVGTDFPRGTEVQSEVRDWMSALEFVDKFSDRSEKWFKELLHRLKSEGRSTVADLVERAREAIPLVSQLREIAQGIRTEAQEVRGVEVAQQVKNWDDAVNFVMKYLDKSKEWFDSLLHNLRQEGRDELADLIEEAAMEELEVIPVKTSVRLRALTDFLRESQMKELMLTTTPAGDAYLEEIVANIEEYTYDPHFEILALLPEEYVVFPEGSSPDEIYSAFASSYRGFVGPEVEVPSKEVLKELFDREWVKTVPSPLETE